MFLLNKINQYFNHIYTDLIIFIYTRITNINFIDIIIKDPFYFIIIKYKNLIKKDINSYEFL